MFNEEGSKNTRLRTYEAAQTYFEIQRVPIGIRWHLIQSGEITILIAEGNEPRPSYGTPYHT